MRDIKFLFIAFLIPFLTGNSFAQVVLLDGSFAGSQEWDADTIKIMGNVDIDGSLLIKPGTCVEFQGHYEIAADSVMALGSMGDSIVFTIHDTTGFSDITIQNGGWKRIHAGSYIELNYCSLEYGKSSTGEEQGIMKLEEVSDNPVRIKNSVISDISCKGTMIAVSWSGGEQPPSGLVEMQNSTLHDNSFSSLSTINSLINQCHVSGNSGCFSGTMKSSYFGHNKSLKLLGIESVSLSIENCVFEHNQGLDILATFCTLNIFNSLFNANHFEHGIITGMFCETYLINNTFYNNEVVNSNFALMNFMHSSFPSSGIIYNNIFYENADGAANGIQIRFFEGVNEGPMFFTIRNNILQGGLDALVYSGILDGAFEDNIDANPLFAEASNNDYHLKASSPCINSGITDLVSIFPSTDLDGMPRILDGRVDIGAYEFNSSSFALLTQPVGDTLCQGTDFSLEINAFGGVICYQWQKDGVAIPGATDKLLNFKPITHSQAGNYNCIIYATSGVKSSDTVPIEVNVPATISECTESFGTCENSDSLMRIQADGTGIIHYFWFKGGSILHEETNSVLTLNSIRLADAGSYMGVAENNCGSDTTGEIILQVFLLPQLNLGEDTTIYTNDMLTLDAGAGFENYLWNTGAEDQLLPVIPTETGSFEYWVNVTDNHGCSGSDTILINVEQGNSTPDYSTKFSLTIYPNPTPDWLYLKAQATVDREVMVSVTDMQGKVYYQDTLEQMVSGTVYSIDMSGLPNGVYLLIIDQVPVRIIKNLLK
jgi:hypothetical protein